MAMRMKQVIGVGVCAALLLVGGYLVKNAWLDKSAGTTTLPAVQSASEIQTHPSPKNSEPPVAPQDDDPMITAVPAPANDHSATATPKPKNEGYTAEVTHEKAAKVKDEISLSEQMKITAILLKKLSASDLKLFQNLSDSGMSLEDKKKAKQVIMQKLTEEEYDELIAIASKYGLSKGKSYEESLHEQK
jgi:hypothetical protein